MAYFVFVTFVTVWFSDWCVENLQTLVLTGLSDVWSVVRKTCSAGVWRVFNDWSPRQQEDCFESFLEVHPSYSLTFSFTHIFVARTFKLIWFIFSDAWVFLADSHKIYSLTNYSCLFGVMLRLISSFLIYSQIYCSSSSFWVMQEATDLVLIYSLTRHNVLPVYFFIHSTFLFPAMLLVLEVVRFLLGVQKKYILKNKL